MPFFFLYKSDILGRMAQLDPNPFWAEQKKKLVADGILNNNAEYTIEALERNLKKWNGQTPVFLENSSEHARLKKLLNSILSYGYAGDDRWIWGLSFLPAFVVVVFG